MNKKRRGGLSIEMIIIAALGLIVLIIVAVIFRTQIFHYSKGYKDTADKAIESAEGRCVSPLFSTITRKCSKDPPAATGWKPVEGNCDIKDEKCWEKVT